MTHMSAERERMLFLRVFFSSLLSKKIAAINDYVLSFVILLRQSLAGSYNPQFCITATLW